jgi:hypothetical protein
LKRNFRKKNYEQKRTKNVEKLWNKNLGEKIFKKEKRKKFVGSKIRNRCQTQGVGSPPATAAHHWSSTQRLCLLEPTASPTRGADTSSRRPLRALRAVDHKLNIARKCSGPTPLHV